MTVSLPQEKVQQIQNLPLQVQPKICSVAHVIGLLVAAFLQFTKPPSLSLFGKTQNKGIASGSIIPRGNDIIFRINDGIKKMDSKFKNSQVQFQDQT